MTRSSRQFPPRIKFDQQAELERLIETTDPIDSPFEVLGEIAGDLQLLQESFEVRAEAIAKVADNCTESLKKSLKALQTRLEDTAGQIKLSLASLENAANVFGGNDPETVAETVQAVSDENNIPY